MRPVRVTQYGPVTLRAGGGEIVHSPMGVLSVHVVPADGSPIAVPITPGATSVAVELIDTPDVSADRLSREPAGRVLASSA